MIKQAATFLGKLSIRRKLFISYLFLLVFSFGILMAYNAINSSYEYKVKAMGEAERNVSQTADFLTYKLSMIKDSIDLTSENDMIVNLCLKDAKSYQTSPGQWLVDNNRFLTLIQSLEVNPDLSSLQNSSDNFQLYMNGGMASVYDSNKYMLMSSAKKQSWYPLLNGRVSLFVRTSREGKNYISYIRRISSQQNVDDYIGIIKVDIPEESIEDILIKSLPSSSSAVMLLNNVNLLFSSGSHLDIDKNQINNYVTGFINSDNDAMHKDVDSGTNRLTMFLYRINVDNTNWTLMLFVPISAFSASGFLIMSQIATMFLILAPLTLPLSYFVSVTATKRLTLLSSHMKKMVNGNFDVQILESGDDEIGTLIKNYNFMLTKISMLMDEKYQLGKKVKGLELKALQAQISPHFLYNTLDLVNLMSLKYNAPRIGTVIRSLSKFYKTSLSNGKSNITIKNELEHIKAYISIQNMRFTDQIDYKNEVPESLYDYEIVKTVLQPIVENAIIHGILEKDSEMGRITINGDLIDRDIYFYIRDDGVGMPPDVLEKILTSSEKGSNGYGVRNVNDRIKLSYGDEYGLSYESTVGVGTTVTIKIKAIKSDCP